MTFCFASLSDARTDLPVACDGARTGVVADGPAAHMESFPISRHPVCRLWQIEPFKFDYDRTLTFPTLMHLDPSVPTHKQAARSLDRRPGDPRIGGELLGS
jgi:hypothetical protein